MTQYNLCMQFGVKLISSLFFPFLVLIGLDVYPISREVGTELSAARQARANKLYLEVANRMARVQAVQPYRRLEAHIAFVMIDGGDYDGALTWFDKADTHKRLGYEGLMAWAASANRAGKSADEIRILLLAGERYPEAEPIERLTHYYRGEGNFTLALEYLVQWQSRAPENPLPAYWLSLFLVSKDPHEASSWLDKAVAMDQRYIGARQSLRIAMAQVELSPEPAYRLLVYGRWLAEQGAWDLAQGLFSEACDNSPEYAEAWAFLGQAHSMLGRGGRDEMIKAVELNTDSLLANVLLAYSYAQSQEYKQAVDHLTIAAALDPTRVVWQIELGNINSLAGELETAQMYFMHAQEMEPDNPQVWKATAVFTINNGIYLRELGLPAARHLIYLQPENAEGYLLAGKIYFALGDLHSAKRALSKTLALDPLEPSAHYVFTLVYLQESNMKRAEYYLNMAEKLSGNDEVSSLTRRLRERYFSGGG
jgi:tetratricopeptide (TPR) repeat protein